jgi:2-C-methyl-D-erythritol 2,4-cyclodiphosphate synthase
MAQKKGFKLVNLDVTITCEKPKISPYVQKMKKNIAEDCSCDLSQINIKATTTEGLGFLGRGEGIAAQAICLMEKD